MASTPSAFAKMKKTRQDTLAKLTQEIDKINSNNSPKDSDDDKFWKPTIDKAGNGQAVIRFLPACAGEDVPFVRVFSHAFQGPSGRWYIQPSLTTVGKPDPVGELNQKLWNTGSEENKALARKQKRTLKFISPIYVVKDPANPEAEGKVFLYKYGKKIFDKLNDAMHPSEIDDAAPINPFDMFEGANFTLRVRKQDGFPNYDKSTLGQSQPLFEDEKKMEEVYNQIPPLKPFVDAANYPSYEELKNQLNRVLAGGEVSAAAPTAEAPAGKTKKAAAPKAEEETDDLDKLIGDLNFDDE